MSKFLQNIFKKCNKRNTYKLYKDNVHKNEVWYQTPGSWPLTLMHIVVIGNPMDFHNRVISIIRGAMSLLRGVLSFQVARFSIYR